MLAKELGPSSGVPQGSSDESIDVCWSSDFSLPNFTIRRRSSAASKDRSAPDTWSLSYAEQACIALG